MNKQQLANKIWESANKMRSKIEANEYKDYILGFIFYKFLSDKEEQYLRKEEFAEEDIKALDSDDMETVTFIQENLGYFIGYKDLFSTWLEMGSDFDVANVTDALSSFSRMINPTHKKVFDGIFETLQTGLSKLGESNSTRTKAIRDLLYLIKDIPMDGKQDYDVLGFIYEYLISNFAANAGKKAGEFYTPHEVSLLMSEIVADHLKDRNEIKIYDPTSGSGSLLINIGKSVAKHMKDANNIKYYAQELKENTYNLTRMNLIMRGIIPDNILTRNGDTLEEDWPYFDETDPIGTYDALYVDAVVSNPPYSQNWDPTGKENEPRYVNYGLAPKSKADYAFLLHDLYHLKPDGIMTIVLPHGVLFRGGEEGNIRKNLIENNNIEAIIGLPANIFFGTGIPTIIMVLKQKREDTDILIVDASKGYEKVGKNNQLRACDIRKIVDAITGKLDIPKFSRRVSKEEIRANDYNLNIPRYVDSAEKVESWDIHAIMFGGIPVSELDELNEYWKELPALRKTLFKNKSEKYVELNTDDIKRVIKNDEEVQAFKNEYSRNFDGFSEQLYNEIILNAENIEVANEKEKISKNIFERMEGIPLVNRYEAYQIFSQKWNKIETDLEIIQTEGICAANIVDPNMVIKKKNGKEVEVQDGWVGHVLPFELIQSMYLKSKLDDIKKKEDRLTEIASEYEEISDSLTEEEKEEAFFDAEKNSFVIKEVSKKIKELKNDEKTSENITLLEQLRKVENTSSEEKNLKSVVKKAQDELVIETKETIEKLSVQQIQDVLKQKWIVPIVAEINQLPENTLVYLETEVQRLADKYKDTFSDVEMEIEKTEKSLSNMMNELAGCDADKEGLNELQKLLGGDLNE